MTAARLHAGIFRSQQGWFALTWSETGLRGISFPLKTQSAARTELKARQPDAVLTSKAPRWIEILADELREMLSGRAVRLTEPPLDFSTVPAFHEKVYRAALAVPRGRTVTYGELAALAGSASAARAVGQAMARNPMPLLVPCHRVLASGGKLGGFTAPGGLETKERLLDFEGGRPRILGRDFDAEVVLKYLAKNDPKLGRLIRRIGAFGLPPADRRSPFHWLLRSIIFQQLHGKAAATIHGRLRDIYGGRDPEPNELLSTSEERLAAAGLSRQKRAALKDLARAAEAAEVPSRKEMERLSDEDIIQRLVPIRGVGRWTVEMMLIFGLGRADVFAVDDFALRKSALSLHGIEGAVDRKTLHKIADLWRPWRTVASWYLWRALDS